MKEKTMKADEIKLRCPKCNVDFEDFNKAAEHIVMHHTISESDQWDYVNDIFQKSLIKQTGYAYIRGICWGIILSIFYCYGRSLM